METENIVYVNEYYRKKAREEGVRNPGTAGNDTTEDDGIMQKYRDMANMRGDFSMIDPSKFLTPTMGEMLEEDLMYNIYKQIDEDTGGFGTEDEILKRAFFSEPPLSTELGYHPDEGVFILKASQMDQSNRAWDLNQIDGDTPKFLMKDIDDGNSGFSINNKHYASFKDYCKSFGEGSHFQTRLVGINTPEVPHFELQPINDDAAIKMTYKEMKETTDKKIKFVYLKYPITKDSNDPDNINKWKARRREDKDIMKFHKVYDKENQTYTYHEIVEGMNVNIDDINATNTYKGKLKPIVAVDDSTYATVVAGYKAKAKVKEVLNDVQGKEIYIMLNANGVQVKKSTTKTSIPFNNWWYLGDSIGLMVEEWKKTIGDIGTSGISYNPYGTDVYGRFLGAIYVKEKVGDNETWINLNKYVLADDDTKTESQPDYSGSPELNEIYNGISDAFQLWSYDKNNIKWLDSFDSMSRKSYNKKMELHKKITGIDFKKTRNCSVMLGDTMFLIPPQSIRNVSHNTYEKVATMRGKGSMVKANSTREHMMELDLYFYGENGINGIPYDFTLPNGEKIKYYMNGLRSLISQFKIAPFLPIENGYINDVLGIEAVTLMNIHLETVEGFPRLLKAVLSLREFNYRVFMPDVPVDDLMKDEVSNKSELSQMSPMFARCFEWELFRYYYQRALIQGTELKQIKETLGFNAYDYSKYYYSKKNTLQPMGMCSSRVSFHVPDQNWLDQALMVKKNRDQNKTNIAPIKLTEAGEKFLKKLLPVYDLFNKTNNDMNDKVNSSVAKLLNLHDPSNNKNLVFTATELGEGFETIKEVLNGNATTLACIDKKDGKSIKNRQMISGYLDPIFSPIVKEASQNPAIYKVSVDELYDKIQIKRAEPYTIMWRFNLDIKYDSLSEEDKQSVKDTLALAVKDRTCTPKDIFKEDKLEICFSLSFDSKSKSLMDNQKLTLADNIDWEVLSIIGQQFGKNDGDDVVDNENTDTGFNEHNESLAFNVQDYKNPANMPFVPYIEKMIASRVSVGLGNQFTEISLKAVDGHAPQYMGGQDTVIELEMLTKEQLQVSAINALPALAIELTKDYKKIMSCWPIKIECDLLQTMGICEVLIDTIEVSTVEGIPGLYSIRMRLTSVDRTQRQREAMRKLESTNNSGHIGTQNSTSDLSVKSYFSLDNTLAKAELYPDLDIPTIEELAKKGYRFIKYSGKKRMYPDPDFYVVYSFPYTAMIIKDMIDKHYKSEVFSDKPNKSNTEMIMQDTQGISLKARTVATLGLTTVKGSENNKAKLYDQIVKDAEKELQKPEYDNITKEQKKEIKEVNELGYIVNFLTACDVQEGWELKQGWRGPIASNYTNQAIEDLKDVNSDNSSKKDKKNNAYAEQVLKLRRDAVRYIDKILSQPLCEDFNYSHLTDDGIRNAVVGAVERIFVDNENGAKLLKLLCPLEECNKKGSLGFNSKNYYKKPHMLRYIEGFTYAAGCVASGRDAYSEDMKAEQWQPNQYKTDDDGKPANAVDENGHKLKDEHGRSIYAPVCLVESNKASAAKITDFDYAVRFGYSFGAFGIRRDYESIEMMEMMHPKYCTINYLPKPEIFMYKDKNGKQRYQGGFVDPYYNYQGYNSQAGIKYKKAILCDPSSGAEAFIRVMLTHLRRQILDGLFFSEIDVIANDFDFIKTKLQGNYGNETMDTGGLIPPVVLDNILKNMPDTFGKSFCTRMAYPFMSAVTNNHPTLNGWLSSRNYDALNMISGSASVSGSDIGELDKFLKACSGLGMLKADKKNSRDAATESQKIINGLMKDVYIAASEDPRIYVMHSFYDMLVNDKRGRLVRAFPTYYMIMVDEGRKIGSWKLHDNFYNMSAIGDIQVVKSRKIAADTCSISMSNMYNSYAQDYDAETSQQYVDIYGLRDVFDSIFSPTKYFEKEEMIRKRMQVPDKVVIEPGVRIHVRLGYTADGSKLPIVFNGKIAEVNVGSTVEIIAQGDGHELMNPLNAFGALEATALEHAQKKITAFKDFRGALAKGGETPRNLLTRVLAAKHGGLVKNALNEFFDGRWFNDNPFGIMHFGDQKMKEIFVEGECTQNLYEVADSTILKGMNDLYSNPNSKKASPILNTSIQDKTFWELLHLAANSGLEYYGAVRDFGMRSTVFLGKANHYYAWAYTIVDGKIVERRKPFQQFHHYDAYTDIVYNNIKATEETLKTNAVGTWESTAMLWGREQATVGPIYLDMNIYPEYQKSMTVNTGLLAAGNGGIDIPLLNHFGEKWSFNPNDDKVNKATAWRVTMNTLRQNVRDMYQGELCVIGDPSVKPYDRFFVNDTYEDMQGQMEVEAVIYSMNAETGFTTTIRPDVIVRHDDPHEAARQQLIGNFCTMLTATVAARLMFVNAFASVDSKLVRAIAKSDDLYKGLAHISSTSAKLAEATGLAKYAESNPTLGKLLNKIGALPGGSSFEEKALIRMADLVEDMSKFGINALDLSKADDVKRLSEIIKTVGDYDSEEYVKAMNDTYRKNKGYLHMTEEDMLKAVKDVQSGSGELDDAFKHALNLNLTTGDQAPVATLEKILTKNGVNNKEVNDIIASIKKKGGAGKECWSDLSKLLGHDEVIKVLGSDDGAKVVTQLRHFKDGAEDMFKTAEGVTKFNKKGIKALLKSDDILDSLKTVFKYGLRFNPASIAFEIFKTSFVFIQSNNAKDILTRWIQSIQALVVYPVQKNGRPMLAGMNGHKGSVFGYPDRDGYDSIQGMVMKTVDAFDKSLGGFGRFLVDEILNRDIYEQTINRYKANLEITEEKEDQDTEESKLQDVYNTVSNELTSRMKTAHALKTRARIQSFDTKNESSQTYKTYRNRNVKLSELTANSNIRKLIPIDNDTDIRSAILDKSPAGVKMALAHDDGGGQITIPFDSGSRTLKFIAQNDVYDLPILQEDCIYVLNRVINQTNLKGKTVHFISGTRINDKRSWKNTGFAFVLECKSSSSLNRALDEIHNETSITIGGKKQNLFEYKMDGDKAMVTVYAPEKGEK